MNRSARNRQEAALGERGRRVLEDGSAQKRRRHADGRERGNSLEDGRERGGDEDRRCGGLLGFTRRDERDRALVPGRAGIRVQARMQLRGDGEREREEEGREQSTRDEGAKMAERFHDEAEIAPRGCFAQGANQRRSPADW